MSYKNKPQIKLYSYTDSAFVLQYIVDDYQSCTWSRKQFEAGQFIIQINFNLPNSQLFEKGMFVQFGTDSKDFGFITNIADAVGAEGKQSQMRTITGYDCRYLFHQRIIRTLNSTDTWTMTGSGELCMRNLIADQCGVNADSKRQLPITNTIPETGTGNEYTVSEAYSNLYDVLVTIATQSECMWFVEFINGALVLNFYEGNDLTATVRLDTDYESLQNGDYTDSYDNFSNAVYVGGQGSGSGREIYEGESTDDEGNSPSGFERFESWDDCATLTDSEEYATEATSMLNEYSQTLTLTGAGLAKSPYEYKEQYDVGDTVKVKFNGIESNVQIQGVTETWNKGSYSLAFEFGKPVKSLQRQLSLLIKKIQNYSATSGATTVTSVKYYDVSTETEMASDEVTYDTIGFTGTISTDKTFTLYLNGKTGAKNYMVYVKNLSGGKVTLTTGVANASTVTLNEGTYCVEIYVDEDGNITSGTLIVDTVESGNNNAVSSSAVASAISDLDAESVGGSGKYIESISETDGVIQAVAKTMDTAPTSGSTNAISSGAVFNKCPHYDKNITDSNYEFVYSEFSPFEIIRFASLATSVSPNCSAEGDASDTGDWVVWNMYFGSNKYATLIAVSPRQKNKIYTGRFWDGVFTGWSVMSKGINLEFGTSKFPEYSNWTSMRTMMNSDYFSTYSSNYLMFSYNNASILYNLGVLPVASGGVLHILKTSSIGRCFAEYYADTGYHYHYETSNVSTTAGTWYRDSREAV